jgi:hypothetical protein
MAISLDTIVSDYLTALKDALTTGADTGDPGAYAGDVHAAAQNYMRAQDLATAIELLFEATELTTALTTTTGGSTTTVLDTSAFVISEQIGNVVTMVTATEAIVGESRTVISNTADALTVAPAFSATTTVGDTYTIANPRVETVVANLRKGTSIADATPGNPYADQRVAMNALMVALEAYSAAPVERNIGAAGLVAAAGSDDTLVVLSGGPYRIDQFKGMRVAVATAGDGIVVSSNENSVTLRGPMAAAAVAADAVTITVPVNDFGGTSAPKVVTHAGPQPGENAYLAHLIDQLQTVIEALTVPS